MARILEASKTLITITDHFKSLEKEDTRIQAQIIELSRTILELVKETRELSGQMKSIEKRFDDKDKMIEALVKITIMEQMEKFRNQDSSRKKE